MALKKPSELFGKKGDNSKISENINGNLNNIKQQFDKVEELKRELEGVTNSIDNSLSEVVDNSINFVEFKEEYSELIDNLNTKIEGIKEDFDDKIDELRAAHLTLNTEITILDKRQNSLHIRGLKDEVIEELQNILNGNVYQNIRSLEEKFDSINEKQLQNLQEGLLNEPPNVDNSDPLTPLDKKYVTLDEFQEQYKLFINRIQKQLSTFGGGGAVRIQDLDDVDISTAKVNDKFLKYNSTSGKWEGADASGGGGGGSIAGISTTGTSTFNHISVGGTAEFFNSANRIYGGNTILNINQTSPNGLVAIGGTFVGFYNAAGNEYSVLSIADAQVELAYNNQLRLETMQSGVAVVGLLSATSLSGSAVGLTSVPSSSLTGALPSLDGSALTGITGSGSGVVVQHDGSSVGTAGTINFSTNLDVTAIHAGIVTVTASGGGGVASTAFINAQNLNVTGFSTFVGLTTFRSDIHIMGNQLLNINDSLEFRGNNGGNSFITNYVDTPGAPGNLYIGSLTGNLELDAESNFSVMTNHNEQAILATKNGSVALYHDGGNKKLETSSTGVTITGTLSATSFSGSGASITNLTGASSGTYGNASAVPVITVDGNGRITGISTVAGSGSGISNVVDDTSPQLGGNLDVQSSEINTSTTNGNIKLTPNGTGCIEVKGAGGNDGTIQLNCSANSHGVKIKSPPHSAAATYTLTLPTNIVNGQFLKTDGSGNLSWAASGTASRTTTNASTGSISQTSSANITIPTPGKTFSLLKVAISAPAYVILYTDSTSRSNDASRSEGTDPTPGSGVLTEVSTTTSGASTFLMTPAVLGWNNDSTPANQIYAKVVNKRATSGSNAITVTLTSVALES